MANREELHIIRSARAGQSAAQLALGKRYLFGGGGLPRSAATALYWLDRAARQEEADAWMLIGSHVPFEIARHASHPAAIVAWYERAFDAGVLQAGLVYARLIFTQPDGHASGMLRKKALRALEVAARSGIADAQWLLAQGIGSGDDRSADPDRQPSIRPPHGSDDAMLKWAMHAAESGVLQAHYALADHAWARANMGDYVQHALPLARAAVQQARHSLSAADALLLFRSAQALLEMNDFDEGEIVRFLDASAQSGNREAQFALGLWCAKIDEHGTRTGARTGLAQYKKSIRWLMLAGEQGVSAAWYALSKIYMKPEFSQRCPADAQRYLLLAAEAGHARAQFDLGIAAWRSRRHDESSDVRAAFWLQKSAAQGDADARTLLGKCAVDAAPAEWATVLVNRLTRESFRLYPYLAARIELAACFGLSRAEALLLDVHRADCGHCLLVDIRRDYTRARRRLIMVQTGEERKAVNHMTRVFDDVDVSAVGPEGNYRQRTYRLKTLQESWRSR